MSDHRVQALAALWEARREAESAAKFVEQAAGHVGLLARERDEARAFCIELLKQFCHRTDYRDIIADYPQYPWLADGIGEDDE